VSRLFLNHGTRVEVSRTTFLVSKCLEIGAEVSQSVLMPNCPVTLAAATVVNGVLNEREKETILHCRMGKKLEGC